MPLRQFDARHFTPAFFCQYALFYAAILIFAACYGFAAIFASRRFSPRHDFRRYVDYADVESLPPDDAFRRYARRRVTLMIARQHKVAL